MIIPKIAKRDIVWFFLLLVAIYLTILSIQLYQYYQEFEQLILNNPFYIKEVKAISIPESALKEKGKTSIEIIKEIAQKKNFKDVELLLDIARCESGLKIRAINKNIDSVDYGLFQFNSIHGYGEKPLDPYWATEKTIEIIRAGGLYHWNASRFCWNK